MKTFTIIFTLILLTSSKLILAQESNRDVLKDTIHLSGYLRFPDGSPCKYFSLRSNTYPQLIITSTDDKGFFRLIALFNDTYFAERMTFQNKGSRFINIVIPFEKYELNGVKEAQRIYPKLTKDTVTFSNLFTGCDGIMSLFSGGNNRFIELIGSMVSYPTKAINANIEGEVSVEFLINNEGFVSNIKLLKGIGYGCDEEVINAISKSPKWNPAIFNGRPRSEKRVFNYLFKLRE